MKYLFKIAVIILIVSPISLASIDDIVDLNILGCYAIKDSSTIFDDYITDYTYSEMKKDSVIKLYYGDRKPSFEISGRYKFTEYPDLMMFWAYMWLTGDEYKYQNILFNTSDSVVYYFDGDANQYSKVMVGYFKQKMDESDILELIELYINTIYTDNPQYLIRSVDEFRSIIDSLGNRLGIDLGEEMQDDIERAKRVIKPYKTIYVDDAVEVECYVWNMYGRKLIRYKFNISERGFEIAEKRVALENVGRFGARW